MARHRISGEAGHPTEDVRAVCSLAVSQEMHSDANFTNMKIYAQFGFKTRHETWISSVHTVSCPTKPVELHF